MSVDTIFKPIGSTTLVGVTPVQLNSQGNNSGGMVSVRIRNLLGTAQYFSWGTSASVSVTVPTAGVPSPNTIGMLQTSVETFELPPNAWVVANAAAAFEMTPGQGP